MTPRTLLLPFASLLLASLATVPAHAELQPLDDTGLRAVQAQAGAPVALPGSTGALNDAWQRLLAGASRSTLDAEAFAADLAAHGLATPLPADVYDGRPVSRLVLNSPPVSLQFDAAELLGAGRGPGAAGSASMGRIEIQALDTRGTTIWTWGH